MSNTVKSLVELFVNVMKRREEHINIDWNYKPALFEISDDKKLMSLSIFKQYMQMRYSGNKGIYVKRSGILKNAQSVIDKLDSKQFYNELNRIPACKVDNSLKKNIQYSLENSFKMERMLTEHISNKFSSQIKFLKQFYHH